MKFELRNKVMRLVLDLRAAAQISDTSRLTPAELTSVGAVDRELYDRAGDMLHNLLNEGTHFSHCDQGEEEGRCKYGDDDCPVMEYKAHRDSLLATEDLVARYAVLVQAAQEVRVSGVRHGIAMETDESFVTGVRKFINGQLAEIRRVLAPRLPKKPEG